MGPFSSLCLTLIPLGIFLIGVQSSVISDHFKNRAPDERVVDQSVNQGLETEDDMMTELNGGALTDFFHSHSYLEEDEEAVVSKGSVGAENSDVIHVQDFLNLTDHDLSSPRSISPKFKGNVENSQVEDAVPKGADDSDQYHEHSPVHFVSDVLKNKTNEATEASSDVLLASSPPESKFMKETSQPAESSQTSESSDLVTPSVFASPSLPSSTPALPPTLESSSDAPPLFSPPAISEPSPVVPPASEYPSPESLDTVSSQSAMDGVDDSDDSLDTLFMELENLNSLNEAVEALNQGPYDDTNAEDRTDVIADVYGGDEADDIFSELFNWFG